MYTTDLRSKEEKQKDGKLPLVAITENDDIFQARIDKDDYIEPKD